MGAVLTLVPYSDEVLGTRRGFPLRRTGVTLTSLSTVALNTVPHGLPRSPRAVFLQPATNGALSAVASLDTSQGDPDPTATLVGGCLGWDATNLYIWSGAAQCIALIEY